MSYPTLEQYNEALQHPRTTFFDPELKNGIVSTTGLGLPLALCGGFALTYCIKSGNKKYAVRCFHKKSDDIESRYKAISNKLKSIKSPYFVDFEFQGMGVNVNGKKAPIVKMAWASGETLGEFLEKNYRYKDKLQALNSSLRSLAIFLEGQGIAHGDIQTGNLMVSNDGKSIQLIDYDGMYVEAIKSLDSENDGHRNFQHPKRDKKAWDACLDRFPFIELNLALRVLEYHPEFWDKTKSDGDSILFRANDFVDPDKSSLFTELSGIKQFSEDTGNFSKICQSPFDKIPTLENFIARKNIPQAFISIKSTAVTQRYIGAFPVLNAGDYELCLKHVGDRVEIIGKIVGVNENKTYNGKPYIFINFGDWRYKQVKIAIWSEGLAALSHTPDWRWEGKWVTVTGLMQPPYSKKKGGYTHLSINITQANQLQLLSEKDAHYRLGSSTTTESGEVCPRGPDQETLEKIQRSAKPSTVISSPTRSPISTNQDILQALERLQHTAQKSKNAPQPSTPRTACRPQPKPAKHGSNCFIASAVYGFSAPETHILREWRDNTLLSCLPGRILSSFYYFVSPSLSRLVIRHKTLKKIARSLLDHFIAWIVR